MSDEFSKLIADYLRADPEAARQLTLDIIDFCLENHQLITEALRLIERQGPVQSLAE
jgi:hypothetical protein